MSGILSLLLGRSLCDRYRVDSVIATGGMGAVCRAFDVKLERHVAVKVVTAVAPDAEEAERLRARFHREARAAARLRHPNVVTVHDFGTDPAVGIDFLVMELLAGEDLCARMRRAGGPLPVEEAVEILREGGMGLAAGHRAGMVHRDVKPGNIYLVAEPGGWEVKLLDFGIAQVRADTDTVTRLTQFGAPHTPRYASPEQLGGGAELSPASDVYSMALTGLEMLSGEHPAGLNSTGDDKLAARTVRRLLQQRPEIPLRLAAVLRRSLRLDPAMRFANADQFLDELNDWDASPSSAPGAAGGYASILPFRGPVTPAASPAPASPVDEGTVIAPPFRPAAAIPLPPPVVAGPPPDLRPGAPPASPDTTAEKPRRRVRIRPAGWLVIILLLSSLLAAALVMVDRPGGPAPRPRPPDAPFALPPAEPAGGVALAREEYQRVTGQGGYDQDDTAFIVVTGSYTPDQMEQARRMLSTARDQGFGAGLANSAVYPQLREGYVVVAVGPYADRAGAQGALGAVRELVAPDAFVKRVTIRRP